MLDSALTIPATLAAAVLSLIVGGFLLYQVRNADPGTRKMQKLSEAVQEGANAYLKRQYSTVAIFTGIIFVIFLAIGFFTEPRWYFVGLAFAIGAVLSAATGFIGMKTTSFANTRVAQGAQTSMVEGLKLAAKTGSIMGLAVIGLGLLGVAVVYYFYLQIPGITVQEALQMLIGMGFGASLVALFARVGGGIFTKAADVGADLVGKVEAGIPEDDPRNPAVIADNVGDNVGDCAGMGADLFESYVVTIIATMILGAIALGAIGALYPLAIAAAAAVASIIGIFTIRAKEEDDPIKVLNRSVFIAAILSAVIFYGVTTQLIPIGTDPTQLNIFGSAVVGLLVALAVVWITDYYTSTFHNPVRLIAESSQTGAATTIITGLAVGLESTAPVLFVVVLGILASFSLAGAFGIAVASMAMLSLTGIIVTIDTFGPVSDNAGGIAEMAGLKKATRRRTDRLDAAGNTTKATTKGFAIASAALAALAMMLAFVEEVQLAGMTIVLDVMNPAVLAGLFIGGALPFLFASFLMKAVGRSAFEVIKEVRRQFKADKGIMRGTSKPDYAKCVDLVTASAQKELLLPGLLAVGAPLVLGFTLGPLAVGGMLAGSIVTGFLLAINMANGGGAWDNAKKFIEDGNLGGKGSEAHKAAVIGDTVGDPYKDTAGPALNSLIKVLNTLSLVVATLFVSYHFFPVL